MPVVAISHLMEINAPSPSTIGLSLRVIVLDTTLSQFDMLVMVGVNDLDATVLAAIQAAVKARMASDYGFSLNGSDTVKLIR